MSNRVRTATIAVALMCNQQGDYFVRFNRRWGGYAFPMTKLRATDASPAAAALRVAEEALGRPLSHPRAEPVTLVDDFLSFSPAVGDRPRKHFYVFEVVEHNEAGEALLGNEPPAVIGDARGYLPAERLDPERIPSLVTGSTRELFHTLMHHQEVAVAIVARREPAALLLIWHEGYRGFFFPAARIVDQQQPTFHAERALRGDAGNWSAPGLTAEYGDRVGDVHFSHRLQRERCYHFHLCRLVTPDEAALTAALQASGRRWGWFTAEQLRQAERHHLSPTVEPLRLSALAVAGMQ